MAPANNRSSTYTQASTPSDHDRPKSSDAKSNMWTSLLDSVSTGKKLPEKNILVLGGTAESQKEFLEGLSSEDSRRPQERHVSKQPPVANSFALGYTYHDVLDADHEDILARLSVYLLADPSPSFTPLLQPLLTPQTLPQTLVVILLDWSQPWFWLRQLRAWIRFLKTLLESLSEECQEVMRDIMVSWRERGRGGNSLDGGGVSNTSEGDVSLPHGPGEWDEALGLPLCVVCQNSDKIESLERDRSWKEDEFDTVLQYMRAILLKHGSSLIYTIPSVPNPLQSLIHSSLGIHSILKRQPLKHNVIDRDKVVVPPNWDSWGKIRVLRDGFDVEATSNGWSVDIEDSEAQPQMNGHAEDTKDGDSRRAQSWGAVQSYEEIIRDPSLDALQATNSNNDGTKLEVSSKDPQDFLADQLLVLEKLRATTDTSIGDGVRSANSRAPVQASIENGERDDEGRVNEHIGPVQFNMGGIQVDADDMMKRLKDRQRFETPEPQSPQVASPGNGDGKPQSQNHEQLASFFAGLMKRGGAGSVTSSPKPAASSS